MSVVGHMRWFRTLSPFFACSRFLKGPGRWGPITRLGNGACQRQRRALLRRHCR